MLNAKFFKGPLNNFDRVKGVQGRLFACDVRLFCRRNSTLKGPQAQAVELLPCQACLIRDVLGSLVPRYMYAHQQRRRRGRSILNDRDTENDDMHCVFLAQNGSLQFADYHSTIVCPLSTSRDAAAGVDRLMGDSGASMKLEGFPCRAQTLVMDWLVATPSWRVEEGQSRPAQPPFKSHILLRSSNGI